MPYHGRTRSATTSAAPATRINASAPVPHCPLKLKHAVPRRNKPFPASNLHLHDDDNGSKVFFAIGRALASVDNCAMTVKDLAESALKNGLSCSGTSPLNAASQQITSFIRAHQRRCQDENAEPLIKCFVLSGTSEDDKFIPALYSRAGGTAQRSSGAVDTAFRKGTQVWYMSSKTGLTDQFEKLGIHVSTCRKRRRVSQKENNVSDSEEEQRPRIKLKIRLGPRSSNDSSVIHLSKDTVRSPQREPTPLEDDMELVDTPPSTPISECSLTLPPYPIESHCHYLRDIPLSPYDVPEYASPPPDSEDDDHDFHASMMAGAEHSDDEFMPSLKYEADSDIDEDDDDGRRSRSTSWTTITDPKTPREGERYLSQPPQIKIEGKEESWTTNIDVKHMLDHWDVSAGLAGSVVDVKEENSNTWLQHWMSSEEVEDLVQLAIVHEPSPAARVKQEEDSEQAEEFASSSRRFVGRSLSTPIVSCHDSNTVFSSAPPSPVLLPIEDSEDVEILGPDSVTVDELESTTWHGRRPALVTRLSRNRASLRVTASEPHVGNSHANNSRVLTVEGVRLQELSIQGHTLRRRLSDSLIHLPGLLAIISHRTPLSKFMQLEGAMHVRSGRLEGTWVPIQFARNLIKDIQVRKEVMSFLQDCPPSSRLQSISPMKLSFHTPPSQPPLSSIESQLATNELLPPITLPITASAPLIDLDHGGVTDYRSAWQRDGFTDWKVNADAEVPSPFPLLAPVRPTANTSTGPVAADCPLSPQEEEILFALVDMPEGQKSARFSPALSPAPALVPEVIESVTDDADDEAEPDRNENGAESEPEQEEEEEAPKVAPRRSKRVASRRISEQTVTAKRTRSRK